MNPVLLQVYSHLAMMLAVRAVYLLIFAALVIQATRTRTYPLADFRAIHIRAALRRRLGWTVASLLMFAWIVFLWGGSEAGAQVCMGAR